MNVEGEMIMFGGEELVLVSILLCLASKVHYPCMQSLFMVFGLRFEKHDGSAY